MATTPPRDLTAERAAATLLERMGLVGHPADAQFIGDIIEFRRQTRREALREAKDVVTAHKMLPFHSYARLEDYLRNLRQGIVKALDRLASEGG